MARTNVILTNRYAFFPDIDDLTFKKLDDYWSYYEPKARYAPAHKLYLRMYSAALKAGTLGDEPIPGWDGRYKFLSNDCCVPAGLFRATRVDLKESLDIRFKVERELPKIASLSAAVVVKAVFPQTDHKYQYQIECVDAMRRAIPRGGGIVISATGTGKTKIAGDFFGLVTVPCLFLVDLISLLYQSQEEISKWLGEPVGVVGNQTYDVQRVTVATVQTLSRHIQDKKFMKWFRHIKIVVVDELHEQMARRNFKLLDKIDPIARYGLTATLQLKRKPVRLKAYAFAGPVLYSFPYSLGRDKGVLKAGQVVQLLFPEITGTENYMEAYQEEIVENTLKRDACVEIVTKLVKAGRYVIVLCFSIEHLNILDNAFSGIPHRLAYGKITRLERASAKALFEKGKIRLIIASVVFKKGENIKRLDAIVDMAEMKSENDVQQKFGRGVRLHAQKKDLLYIDIGTQSGRFFANAKKRIRALRANDVPVTKHVINTVTQAVKAIKECL